MKKLFLLVTITLVMISCSSDDNGYGNDQDQNQDQNDDQSSGDDDPVAVVNTVQLRNDTTFGSVLTNGDGFTLYFFAPDSKGASNCLEGCATVWPSFNTSDLTLDTGLEAADFGSITRSDGGEQTTYKGWPLYVFSNDAAPGDINGDGAGGTWFVAKPDYSVMFSRSQLVGRDSAGIETNLNSSFEEGDEETFYITDANGNTLYHFINDENGTNNFTNPDFSNNGVWPIFHVELQNVPSILNRDGFGVIDVFGEPQLTYKGWPLYTFSGDENRGDNFGVGFPSAGVWPILNPETELAPNGVANKMYTVTNQGASAYIFSGEDLTDAANPDFTLKRGETYEFNINTPGHPFIIKSVQGTGTENAFNEGVTGNGSVDGTIVFTVPTDAPNTLFYNCEFHGSMTGMFTIVD